MPIQVPIPIVTRVATATRRERRRGIDSSSSSSHSLARSRFAKSKKKKEKKKKKKKSKQQKTRQGFVHGRMNGFGLENFCRCPRTSHAVYSLVGRLHELTPESQHVSLSWVIPSQSQSQSQSQMPNATGQMPNAKCQMRNAKCHTCHSISECPWMWWIRFVGFVVGYSFFFLIQYFFKIYLK